MTPEGEAAVLKEESSSSIERGFEPNAKVGELECLVVKEKMDRV